MTDHQIGTQPIQPEVRMHMNAIGEAVDDFLNPSRMDKDNDPREWLFVLMVFPSGVRPGRCNYVSTADREDVITLLREQLAYFGGAPEAVDTPGHS